MLPSKWLVAAIVVLAACGGEDERPEMPNVGEVFPNLPLPPQPTFVSRSGGADALQLTVTSPAKAPEVERYYRSLLTKNGWRLVNDTRDREGAVVLLAQRDGPPLWVRIKSTDDSAATIVELAGAVIPDSTKPPPKPAS